MTDLHILLDYRFFGSVLKKVFLKTIFLKTFFTKRSTKKSV